MNPRLSPGLVLAVLLTAPLLPAAPADPGPAGAAARSERIRAQIDALLAARLRPPPLPVDPPNPFAAPATGIILPVPPAAGERVPTVALSPDAVPPVASNAEVLARLASRIRIGGLIRLKDSVQVVVNDSPMREGDSFVVEREPRIIQLQIVRIQPGQLTVRYEDAELVVRF